MSMIKLKNLCFVAGLILIPAEANSDFCENGTIVQTPDGGLGCDTSIRRSSSPSSIMTEEEARELRLFREAQAMDRRAASSDKAREAFMQQYADSFQQCTEEFGQDPRTRQLPADQLGTLAPDSAAARRSATAVRRFGAVDQSAFDQVIRGIQQRTNASEVLRSEQSMERLTLGNANSFLAGMHMIPYSHCFDSDCFNQAYRTEAEDGSVSYDADNPLHSEWKNRRELEDQLQRSIDAAVRRGPNDPLMKFFQGQQGQDLYAEFMKLKRFNRMEDNLTSCFRSEDEGLRNFLMSKAASLDGYSACFESDNDFQAVSDLLEDNLVAGAGEQAAEVAAGRIFAQKVQDVARRIARYKYMYRSQSNAQAAPSVDSIVEEVCKKPTGVGRWQRFKDRLASINRPTESACDDPAIKQLVRSEVEDTLKDAKERNYPVYGMCEAAEIAANAIGRPFWEAQPELENTETPITLNEIRTRIRRGAREGVVSYGLAGFDEQSQQLQFEFQSQSAFFYANSPGEVLLSTRYLDEHEAERDLDNKRAGWIGADKLYREIRRGGRRDGESRDEQAARAEREIAALQEFSPIQRIPNRTIAAANPGNYWVRRPLHQPSCDEYRDSFESLLEDTRENLRTAREISRTPGLATDKLKELFINFPTASARTLLQDPDQFGPLYCDLYGELTDEEVRRMEEANEAVEAGKHAMYGGLGAFGVCIVSAAYPPAFVACAGLVALDVGLAGREVALQIQAKERERFNREKAIQEMQASGDPEFVELGEEGLRAIAERADQARSGLKWAGFGLAMAGFGGAADVISLGRYARAGAVGGRVDWIEQVTKNMNRLARAPDDARISLIAFEQSNPEEMIALMYKSGSLTSGEFGRLLEFFNTRTQEEVANIAARLANLSDADFQAFARGLGNSNPETSGRALASLLRRGGEDLSAPVDLARMQARVTTLVGNTEDGTRTVASLNEVFGRNRGVAGGRPVAFADESRGTLRYSNLTRGQRGFDALSGEVKLMNTIASKLGGDVDFVVRSNAAMGGDKILIGRNAEGRTQVALSEDALRQARAACSGKVAAVAACAAQMSRLEGCPTVAGGRPGRGAPTGALERDELKFLFPEQLDIRSTEVAQSAEDQIYSLIQ